jgi:hypothetical protein
VGKVALQKRICFDDVDLEILQQERILSTKIAGELGVYEKRLSLLIFLAYWT